MSERTPDVIVIGAGPNGLVAACTLARAGLSVLVLEAHAARAGGAVGSEAATLPGFVHDVGAAFFPFARASPAFRALDLVGHGLAFCNAPIESAHPGPDESVACLVRRPTKDAPFGSARDEARWAKIAAWHRGVESDLLAAMLSPLLGRESLVGALALFPENLVHLARIFLASGRRLSARLFESEAARRVIPGLALHTDVGPDDLFGSGIGYMLAVMATTGGYAIPRGGAGAITNALLSCLRAHGGELRLGAGVRKIVVEWGRAIGVELRDGTTIPAARAVLANTSAPGLFLDLVDASLLPGRIVRKMRRFASGWGTFKLDFALAGAVPWAAEPCRRAAVVHAGDSVDDLSRFTAQVRKGEIPDNPYLVIGQQSLADPARAPQGKHTLWAYSRVPSHPPGGWAAHAEAFGDRVEARIEGLAPGFRARVLARHLVPPDRLEAMDANLRGGDLGGGSNAFHRQLVFRPIFPWFHHRTPVRRLYLCSSYTHPGAGVHGMCGYNAARIALAEI